MAVSKSAGAYYSRTTNLPSITSWTVMGWVNISSAAEGQSFFYFGGNPTGNRYVLEYTRPPRLISFAQSNVTDSAANDEATSSISWQTGDRILVKGTLSNNADSGGTPQWTLSTPTATGLTFTLHAQENVGEDPNAACPVYFWTATAASDGSGVISAVTNNAPVGQQAFITAEVWRNCSGFGTPVTLDSSAAKTVNLTRVQANSCVSGMFSDWNAAGDAAVNATPTGTVQLASATALVADFFVLTWGDQGATGTTAYGITDHVGTVDMTAIVVEVFGVPTFNIANTDDNFRGITEVPQNEWHHIALTCSGSGAGQLLMYLDGVLEITADGRAANTAGIMRLGGDAEGVEFAGQMAHWKVFDSALTQAEVQAEMACKYPKKNTGLNGYYRLDDTATDQEDFSTQGRTLTVTGTPSAGSSSPTFTGIQVERVTNKATVNTGTATVQFIGSPTIGNRIITAGEVWHGAPSGNPPLVDDTSFNTYGFDATPQPDGNAEGLVVIASALIQATSSGLQVEWATDVTDCTKTFVAIEVSGLASSPVDKTAVGTDATSPFEVTTATLSQAEELVVGAFLFIGVAAQDEGIGLTTWGGRNPVTLFTEDGVSIVGEFGAAGYAFTNSTAAVTVGFVADNDRFSGQMAVTYKASIDTPPITDGPPLYVIVSPLRW